MTEQVKEWAMNQMVKLISGVLGSPPEITQEGKITIYHWQEWLYRVKVEPTPDGNGFIFGAEMKKRPDGRSAFPMMYDLLFEIVSTVLTGGKDQ